MIEVEHLTRRFGDVIAVNDVSFAIAEGDVVGFLGPNGAGKSTTLKILSCYQPATRGNVRIAGLDVLTRSLEVRARLGYLPETVPVYPDMRVEEFLRFRALLKGVSRRRVASSVDRALERCGCADMRRRMIGGLSKGYRQRVGLADAVVHDPPILILDEPTSGLDPNQRVEVRRLIADLGRDHTVILSSHILAEVEAAAERVLILHRGRLVADDTFAGLVATMGGGNVVHVEARGAGSAEDGTEGDAVRAIDRRLRALPGAGEVARAAAGQGFTAWTLRFAAGADGDRRPEVARAVLEAGADLRALERISLSLEEIFRRLTSDQPAAPPAIDRRPPA